MSADTKYNGWTNYATWRVNLEIVDDYVSSLDEGDIEPFADLETFASHLEEMVDDVLTNYGEIEEGLALDYARAFVSDVDWYDIAQNQASGDDAWLIASDEEEGKEEDYYYLDDTRETGLYI